jgi:DNA-binding MarR family transcriptional regulator
MLAIVMDNEAHRTYQILEEISSDQHLTQRKLSGKLGIALGLTNLYLKRLIRKGYVMVETMPRNRIAYNLTPKGLAEKSKLTYEYMKYSFNFYKKLRSTLKTVLLSVEKEEARKIVFYGAGEIAEIAYLSLQGAKLELVAVVDDGKAGRNFFGKRVKTPESLNDISYDRVIVTALASKEKIYKKALELGVAKEKLILI